MRGYGVQNSGGDFRIGWKRQLPESTLVGRPLFRGGFGAVELAVRAERIRFGAGAVDPLASDAPRAEVVLGNSDRAYTFGVNWYVNRWVKIQANLVRNTIGFPEQGPSPSQPVYWSRLIRFQFSM